MNKRGLEDSVFTWIVAFSIILFIMFIYTGMTFGAFIGKGLFFQDNSYLLEGSVDLVNNRNFLEFLNSNLDNEEMKIIDFIRFNLEPFSEIKNENGESFLDIYGIKGVNELIQNPTEQQRNDIEAKGFTGEQYFQLGDESRKIQESEFILEIINQLDELCPIDERERYFFELPYGIITEDGMKASSILNDISISSYNEFIHKTVYKGDSFEIRLLLDRRCL